MLKIVINKNYKDIVKPFLKILPKIFEQEGEVIAESRNIIKIFQHENIKINVKAFKKPHFINQIVYSNFRESKAERSYRYGLHLIDMGINTPMPLAYTERKRGFLFKESSYISVQEDFDGGMRDLFWGTIDEHRELIIEFAKFTASLHRRGVLHLDYSSGNILYKKENSKFSFYLVDLNRMVFDKNISIDEACHNFRRLWGTDEMIKLFAYEYGKARNFSKEETIEKTFKYREIFWRKFRRKYPDAIYYGGVEKIDGYL